jgi:predicted protein tyrosine phosphatase
VTLFGNGIIQQHEGACRDRVNALGSDAPVSVFVASRSLRDAVPTALGAGALPLGSSARGFRSEAFDEIPVREHGCPMRATVGVIIEFPEMYKLIDRTRIALPAATRVVDESMIGTSDVIFVMERHHRDKIRKRFRSALGQRPVYVLGIPDEYERDQKELIALLKERVPSLLHQDER